MKTIQKKNSVPGKAPLKTLRVDRRTKKSREMQSVLQPLAQFMNELYLKPRSELTGVNKVFSYNAIHAWKEHHRHLHVDFEKLMISKGPLPNAPHMTMCSPDKGIISINWTDNSGIGKALANDQFFIVVHSDSMRMWSYTNDAAERRDGGCEIEFSFFCGKPAVVYVGFLSEDRSMVSESICLGTLNIL